MARAARRMTRAYPLNANHPLFLPRLQSKGFQRLAGPASIGSQTNRGRSILKPADPALRYGLGKPQSGSPERNQYLGFEFHAG